MRVAPPSLLILLVLLGLGPGPGRVWAQDEAPPADPVSEPAAEPASEPAAEPASEPAASPAPEPPAETEEATAAEEEAPAEGGGAEEESQAKAEGGEAEAEGEGEGEGGEEAEPQLQIPKRLSLAVPEALRPEVEVVFVADGECRLSADGRELGVLPAGEKRRVALRAGDHWLKARSVEVPGASWDKVVTVRPGAPQTIEVKMLKAIRDLERNQRQTGVYRDPKSDLMWTKKDNGGDLRWRQAVAYCEDLTLAGYDDWRLPSLEELRSLRALWSQATFKIAGQIGLTACCPWSTDLAEDGKKAWNFNYVHRRPFLGHVDYSYSGRALCVRIVTEEEELREAAERAAEGESEVPGEDPAGGAQDGAEQGEGFPPSAASHW